MGTKKRPKPTRLGEKLLDIRSKLGLSQNGMIRRMGLSGKLVQAEISAYEHELREPPLSVLLQYARAANLLVEWLIDDEINLPDRLPAAPLPKWVSPKHSANTSKTERSRGKT
jgi:transcriptional regulator with XRE-family HTH domain